MFALGWIAGIDNEQKRIRRAFSLEGYTYDKFFKVLSKYEKLEEQAGIRSKNRNR